MMDLNPLMSPVEKIRKFYHSDSFWAGLFRDFLFVIIVVAVFASVSQVALGLWTPMVAVESESMVPHIQIGDIIIIESIDRTGIVTWKDGKQRGYTSFDDYGDVILYRPFGRGDKTPIIHRAMYFIEKGEPMWDGGPPAPHAGYITKGDNNPSYDQRGLISYLQPVRKEWVIGVSRFTRVPILGCISLAARGNFACTQN
jgi:signal peptidase I